MKRPAFHLALFCSVLAGGMGCQSLQDVPKPNCDLADRIPDWQTRPSKPDPYAPELHSSETLTLEGTAYGTNRLSVYRFSTHQLAEMAKTSLDETRFVAYLEQRWPIERLRAYCVPANRFPPGYQNLVVSHQVISTTIHQRVLHGFERISVYVNQDDGDGSYVESAGWNWRRWKYSLNVVSKTHHWCIIESLPNDFMDSPAYDPQSAAVPSKSSSGTSD